MKCQHETCQEQNKPNLTAAHIRIDLSKHVAETGQTLKAGEFAYVVKYVHVAPVSSHLLTVISYLT